MAFNPNFSATQTLGLPNIVTLTDMSTGSDAAIASRRIYLEQYNGSFLVPSGTTTDYIVWATGSASKTLDVLTVDTALNITLQWLSVGGTVLYESTQLYVFTLYNEQFDYGLTSDQSAELGAAFTFPDAIVESATTAGVMVQTTAVPLAEAPTLVGVEQVITLPNTVNV